MQTWPTLSQLNQRLFQMSDFWPVGLVSGGGCRLILLADQEVERISIKLHETPSAGGEHAILICVIKVLRSKMVWVMRCQHDGKRIALVD